MSDTRDIRVVVGLDFGTTYSGFTYCHVSDEEFITNDSWPGDRGSQFKTNTVLQYDESLTNVISWGYPALSRRPNRRLDRNKPEYVVELFKLHVGDISTTLRERYTLPVNYKKAVTDYLREIGNLIKETIAKTWDDIEFFENVLLVLTVPAEYTERPKAIMRECAYNAGLIDDINSESLQFTTEPEAAAIYCMENCLREHDLTASGTTFMIVDSGGGTVDLTTVKLLNEKQLGEVTERTGDYCGSALIDEEFRKLLETELGAEAFKLLRDNYYGHLQFMVQEFCQNVKFPFTGDDPTIFYEVDLERLSPVLLQRLKDETRRRMEAAEWLIRLDYEKIKSMFDSVIKKILHMIDIQIENSTKCSVMFLVGGFSQSEYLQKKIREKFGGYEVYVPTNPIAAVSRGAAIYGLSFKNADDMSGMMFVIDSRVLKSTYGIKVYSPWEDGDRKELFRFHVIARRGTSVNVNEEFATKTKPTYPSQSRGEFEIYRTTKYEPKYCDERDDAILIGKLIIDWPDTHLGKGRPTTFKLTFGQMEIKAAAINETNGQNYQTSFKLDED